MGLAGDCQPSHGRTDMKGIGPQTIKALEILSEFQQLGIRNSYVSEMIAEITK